MRMRTADLHKTDQRIVITLAAPLEAQAQPMRAKCESNAGNSSGATFKVEATNNPFDPSPAWRIAQMP